MAKIINIDHQRRHAVSMDAVKSKQHQSENSIFVYVAKISFANTQEKIDIDLPKWEGKFSFD